MSKQQSITIDVSTLKPITCSCGSKYFQQVYSMVIIPRFSLPGIMEDAIKQIPFDKCASCGLIHDLDATPATGKLETGNKS